MEMIPALNQLKADIGALPHDQDGFVALGAVVSLVEDYIAYMGECQREDDIELILSSLTAVIERLEIVELKVREINPRKDN